MGKLRVLSGPLFDSLEYRVANLKPEAGRIEVVDVITGCRDPKDNKFLELAASGKASHIVTGNSDLLVLHPFREIAIVNPQAFLAIPGDIT